MKLTAFDFEPTAGLERIDTSPTAWRSTASRVQLRSETPLPPGWYRFRFHIRMSGDFAIRKKAILTADGQPLETLEWSRDCQENLLISLKNPAKVIALDLHFARGDFDLSCLELGRVSPTRALARALRLKLRLVTDYNCFWPVLRRGTQLLAHGNLREFGSRVLRGIGDSRSMRLEIKRADEVAASWWRRGSLTAESLRQLREEAAAVLQPRPIAVFLPATLPMADHARQALLSVLRQAYPHWEAFVLWSGGPVARDLQAMTRWDSRIQIVNGESLPSSLAKAIDRTQCPRFLFLPPDCEMSETALLRMATQLSDEPISLTFTDRNERLSTSVYPVKTALEKQAKLAPDAGLPELLAWSADELGPFESRELSESAIRPFQGGQQRFPVHPRRNQRPLIFSANICGLSGWDHVAFEVLKGLDSLGVPLQRNYDTEIYSELLPPGVVPESTKRLAGQPQLVIAPPFACDRFRPDTSTAIYTMWEVDRLERKCVESLNRTALVIVPSRWGAECLRASGVTVPIEVVPLGYDPLIYHPAARKNDSTCIFGTAGALSHGGLRKNVRRVIDLFRKAFPTESDARLRVKITPNCPPLDMPTDGRIELIRMNLTANDLAEWNRSLTAYVNGSFAEGFGLHLLEAMACGVPLISTKYSGLTAFFDEATGFVVPHTITPVHNDVYQGQWADPSDEGMIAAMRAVYRDREAARVAGLRSAARARGFTWRDTGRQLIHALTRHRFLGESS